jgi:hypothetical protein
MIALGGTEAMRQPPASALRGGLIAAHAHRIHAWIAARKHTRRSDGQLLSICFSIILEKQSMTNSRS